MSPDEVRAITDPIARIDAATQAIVDTRAELLAIRRDAVRELRKTRSLAEIAGVLGVTRSRVQEMGK